MLATALAGLDARCAVAQTRQGPIATEPGSAGDQPDASSTGIADIVVTSNRSGAESLQNVPAAITAINVTQVDRGGLGNLADIAKFTPSLSITEGAPGFNKFDLRGLSSGAYRTSDTSDRSLVAVYLDDTPISVQGQTPDLRVYDLERVEVLRGPQGTLYGASSMAGTIRFITAQPDLHSTFGTIETTGAETEHGEPSYSLRTMVNTPLIDGKLALRATLYQGEDGGYIDNIGLRDKNAANFNQSTQGRVALRATPSDDLVVDLAYTFEHSRSGGLNTVRSGLPAYTTSTNSPEGTSDTFQLYTLNVDYDIGVGDIIATTSYTNRRIGYHASPEAQIGYFFQDYGSGLPVGQGSYPLFTAPSGYSQQIANRIPSEQYTIDNKIEDEQEEVRYVTDNTGAVTGTVGAFFEHQTRHLYQDIPTPGFDNLSYENYFYGPFSTANGRYNSQTVDGAFNANDIFSGLQNEEEFQIAAYVDATWHVTPELDLTAGVRYFNFHENYFLFESGVYGVINHAPLTLNTTQNASDYNPRFNVAYHIDPDLMVYAEAAKGFRYGGANQPVPTGATGVAQQCQQNLASYGYTKAPLTFGPDHLWNYSIGEKAKILDGRMTFDADVFYIDWTDVQTRLLLNCSYFFTSNKGAVTSKGVEVETTYRVTPELTLSANVSYTDAQANGDIPTVGAFDSDQTPYSPTWTAGLFGFYDRPVGEGEIHLQAGYQYRGKEHTTFDPYATTLVNGVELRNGASQTYAVIPANNNVSLSLAYDIGRYELGVYGNNLINGVKVTDIQRATYYKIYQAGDSETVARPLTVGARLKVKF